ncbi:hypothetical protein GLAREA_02022 [Glarea lozoyensis ATCC 20868]|uniref:Uncharacterized protein n=1 Tax=Glarea lozoyensis (strain ATCC 20868 / MF5171) TaxID=1116229 RepID=S3CJZ5_GLAL2|nr:uncharacterized protein GLAREA_02022 [Glarea lozoyensis ATCC 20868]EPE26110.1 hypothetical protein GLAREA_02022 [Glarea lozoyensis ATCC 20868]
MYHTELGPDLDIGELLGVRFSDNIGQEETTDGSANNPGNAAIVTNLARDIDIPTIDLLADVAEESFESASDKACADTARLLFLEEQLSRTSKTIEPLVATQAGPILLCGLCAEVETVGDAEKEKEWRSKSSLQRHQDGQFHVPQTRWYRQMRFDHPDGEFRCHYRCCPKKFSLSRSTYSERQEASTTMSMRETTGKQASQKQNFSSPRCRSRYCKRGESTRKREGPAKARWS